MKPPEIKRRLEKLFGRPRFEAGRVKWSATIEPTEKFWELWEKEGLRSFGVSVSRGGRSRWSAQWTVLHPAEEKRQRKLAAQQVKEQAAREEQDRRAALAVSLDEDGLAALAPWERRYRKRDAKGQWVVFRAPATGALWNLRHWRAEELRAAHIYVQKSEDGSWYFYWRRPYAAPMRKLSVLPVDVGWALAARNPAATARITRQLEARGVLGQIAAQLYRAQKASNRAKQSTGYGRMMLYGLKGDELAYLCRLLKDSNLKWGWGEDRQTVPSDVLYIDLPTGQVSFHAYSPTGKAEPAYAGQWDGTHESQARIVQFCQQLLRKPIGGIAPSGPEVGPRGTRNHNVEKNQ